MREGVDFSPDQAQTTSVPIREGFARTPDGVNLYYRTVGSGTQTVIAPFALYHGTSLDALAVDRRIVTYDPRGRGQSDPVEADKVSLDHLLIDLETVRKAVSAEKIAIIGWSGAGMETYVYALRYPKHVSRLIQLAPVAARFNPYSAMMIADRQQRTDQSARAALQQRIEAGEFADNPAEHCRAYSDVADPPLFADPRNLPTIPDVCIYENELPENLGRYFGALFESINNYDWRSSLNALEIPRLVIHGAQDNIPLQGNKEWVSGITSARLLVIDNAGHWPVYEQPQTTLSAIDTFLSGSWPIDALQLPN